MTVEEMKQAISDRTGIPVILLTGETAEENIIKAKALLAYKKEKEAEISATTAQTTKNQFSDWIKTNFEDFGREEKEQPEVNVLADLEESLQVVPNIRDGGNSVMCEQQGDGRSTSDLFADWMQSQFEYNPIKEGGWKPL